MSVALPPFEPPPPREPWEEPRPEGWGSSLPDLAFGLLRFTAGVGAALLALRMAHTARRMGRHRLADLEQVMVVGLWLLAAVLVVGLLVYLWRRLGGMAVLLAMVTDYGRVARMRGRPPVWLDGPPERGLRLAHFSDLHLGENPRVRLVERAAPAGNDAFSRLLDLEAVRSAELLLFTGDVTDRGTAGSWSYFLDELGRRGLLERTVLVPGNHDVNMVEHFENVRADDLRRGRGRQRLLHQALRSDRLGIVQLANLYKFARAFSVTAGGRRGVVLASARPKPPESPDDGDLSRARVVDDREVITFGEAWAAVEQEVRPLIEALPTLPVPPLTVRGYLRQRRPYRAFERRLDEARERLLALFPIAIPLEGQDAALFILNSSTRVSRHPALNAVGYLGAAQCGRLDELARFVPQRMRLIAVHHHTARRAEEAGEDWKSRLFAKFQTLGDSFRLLRFCRERNVRAVLNGHRHLSYQVRLPSGTVLLAAPSSTLGDELAGDPRPQVELYTIAPEGNGPSVGIYRAVHRPPAATP